MDALIAHAGAGRIVFQVGPPTTRAEAVISKAPAMYAPTTFAADLLSRVVVTSFGSDPSRLVLDAPTNHPSAESMKSALDTPKTRASIVSKALVVDTLTHSLIGT